MVIGEVSILMRCGIARGMLWCILGMVALVGQNGFGGGGQSTEWRDPVIMEERIGKFKALPLKIKEAITQKWLSPVNSLEKLSETFHEILENMLEDRSVDEELKEELLVGLKELSEAENEILNTKQGTSFLKNKEGMEEIVRLLEEYIITMQKEEEGIKTLQKIVEVQLAQRKEEEEERERLKQAWDQQIEIVRMAAMGEKQEWQKLEDKKAAYGTAFSDVSSYSASEEPKGLDLQALTQKWEKAKAESQEEQQKLLEVAMEWVHSAQTVLDHKQAYLEQLSVALNAGLTEEDSFTERCILWVIKEAKQEFQMKEEDLNKVLAQKAGGEEEFPIWKKVKAQEEEEEKQSKEGSADVWIPREGKTDRRRTTLYKKSAFEGVR